MSPEFERFYESHLSGVEGGVVDHDLDKGGATWYGISTGFLQGIGRTGPISKSDAKQIAFDYFWQPHELDAMDPVAAWSYCDALFNHSPTAAAKMFQVALDVKDDGIVGPKTREAAKTINQKLFVERYRVARTRYYASLVENDSTQLAFLVGWVDRIHRLNQSMLMQGLFKGELLSLSWYKTTTAKASGWGVLVTGVVTTLAANGISVDGVIDALPKGGVVGLAVAWLSKHNFKNG